MKATSGASDSERGQRVLGSFWSITWNLHMRTYRIVVGEDETETVCLVEIERVCVQDPYVNLPFSEVVCFDEVDAWRETMFGLASSIRVSWFIERGRRAEGAGWMKPLDRRVSGKGSRTFCSSCSIVSLFQGCVHKICGKLTFPSLFAANMLAVS